MADTPASSNGGGKSRIYGDEQVAVLEAFYAECPSPSASMRQQMKRDNLVLKDIDDTQIEVWFQQRSSRGEKLKKQSYEVELVRERLMATNNRLVEDNVNLKKTVVELLHENHSLHKHRRNRMQQQQHFTKD